MGTLSAILALIGTAASVGAAASAAKKKKEAEKKQAEAMAEEERRLQAERTPNAAARLANLGGLNRLMMKFYGSEAGRNLSPGAVLGQPPVAPAPIAAPAPKPAPTIKRPDEFGGSY